jgi:TRAP-type C4-dicarboxylate transport system permease small subunit
MKIDSAVKWVERIASVPSKALHWLSMAVLLSLMFLTVGDVVGRYLVGIIPGLGPIPGSFELTEFMLAVIVLTAIGHTQMKDEHISIDLIVEKFSPKVRAIIDTVTNFLSLAMYVRVRGAEATGVSVPGHSSHRYLHVQSGNAVKFSPVPKKGG